MLLSSHILSEVEALCDRVTIIRAGRTVETGTLAELRHLTRITIEAETADGRTCVEQVEPGELQATLERLVTRGRDVAGQPPADARGAVPAALRRLGPVRRPSGVVGRDRPARAPGSRCGATG